MSSNFLLETIQEDEALDLVSSGQALYDHDLIELLSNATEKLIASWCIEPTETEFFKEYWIKCRDEFLAALGEIFERKSIEYKNHQIILNQEIRIKPHTIFRVKGATADTVMGLAALIASAEVAEKSWLGMLGTSVSVVEIIRKVNAHYIKLSDPVEKEVFEKVWFLSQRFKVNDYDALRDKRFKDAFRVKYPTDDEVVDELNKIHAADTRRAIADLINRELLVRDSEGSLRVAF